MMELLPFEPESKMLTAKVTFNIYKGMGNVIVNTGCNSNQWTAGNAYTAKWENGFIIIDSDTAPYHFGGTEKELVYENFIFWGENND